MRAFSAKAVKAFLIVMLYILPLNIPVCLKKSHLEHLQLTVALLLFQSTLANELSNSYLIHM